MVVETGIPSVNYHLWKPCNMKCGFCFATFEDMPGGFLPKGHLGRVDSMAVIEALAQAGFRKINFAGGEPTLCPWLIDLILESEGPWADYLGGHERQPNFRRVDQQCQQ